MKVIIENLLEQSLQTLQKNAHIGAIPAYIQVESTRDRKHGDFSSNLALTLAKDLQRKPREIAELILKHLPSSDYIQRVEIAGPGFLNFFVSALALTEIAGRILQQKEGYGRSDMGQRKKVLVEFVSSNPTGPLHVGHGRHAAFGDVIANLLNAVGFDVSREYYMNNAGRQVDILAVSVWLRYLALFDATIPFPVNAYQGGYVVEIAKLLCEREQEHFRVAKNSLFDPLPADEIDGGDKEIYIDAVILQAKQLLGEKYATLFNFALNRINEDIKGDLEEFGVQYDSWYSEQQLFSKGMVDQLIERLRANDDVYTKEGALWFRSTRFGDEKDRVLIRSNGQHTYFASDAAYHLDKFNRGFDIALDLFGADHHGYLPRIKSVVAALGINPERLQALFVQFVTLYRNGQQAQMSTRGGNFVTLRELRDEVGNDAARFFYVMRKAEQPMDFDLDLAKSQSNDNPVYYVQYAYARIMSVFRQLQERQLTYDEKEGLAHLASLDSTYERQLLLNLSRYPYMVVDAALHNEPHQLTHYLRDVASDFHAYYNAQPFIVDESAMRNARLVVLAATRQVLLNGFVLLGIHAPERM